LLGQNINVATSDTSNSVVVGRSSVGATGSIIIGSDSTAATFTNSIVIGREAAATANGQFVVGSTTYQVGAVANEVNTSSLAWNVIINGVARKILLA